MVYERNSFICSIDPKKTNIVELPSGATRVSVSSIEATGTLSGNVQSLGNLVEDTGTKISSAGARTLGTLSSAGIIISKRSIAGVFSVAGNRLIFTPTVATKLIQDLPVDIVVTGATQITGKSLRYIENAGNTAIDLGYTSQAAVTSTAGSIIVHGSFGASKYTIGSEFVVANGVSKSEKTITGNLPYDIVRRNLLSKGALTVQVAKSSTDTGISGNTSYNSSPVILPVLRIEGTVAGKDQKLVVSDRDNSLKVGIIHATVYSQNGFAGTLQEQIGYGGDQFGKSSIIIEPDTVSGEKAEVVIDVDQEHSRFTSYTPPVASPPSGGTTK